MSDQIKHDGIIENILDKTHLQVRIVQTSACASCKIASHCTSSESKEKIIDVWTSKAQTYSIGQNVVVTAATKTGRNAVIIGFVIPAVLVFATVAAMVYFLPDKSTPEGEMSEAIAALSGLAILIPYYICLYFFRGILREKFSFSLES